MPKYKGTVEKKSEAKKLSSRANWQKAMARMEELRQLPEGANSKATQYQLALLQLDLSKNIDRNNVDEVTERIVDFLNVAIEFDQRPTLEDFCVALGSSRETVRKWRTGELRHNPEVVEVINKLCNMLQARLVSTMVDMKTQPATGIFLLKNNYENYRDVQDVKITANDKLNSASEEELNKKYLKNVKDIEATDITDEVIDVK